MKSMRRPAFTAITVLILLGAFGSIKGPAEPAQGSDVFPLHAPPFASVARADDRAILSVIGDEAGIAAYFQAATPIDMVSVEDAFRTIEAQTTDYIIGSVEVLNYPESEDVHVYVHRDGWILAYYLAADPVSKIFDWRAYRDTAETNLTTKLENTLIKVAGYAVVTYPGCTYYDFRYPNATHLTLIAEWVYATTDSFEVNLPGTFSYYERSWSIGYTWSGTYTLDGTPLYSSNPQTWATDQGFLTAAQLLPEQFHTITIDAYRHGYAGLALVYRVP